MNSKIMNKYILTFESYSKRRKKKKSKIWDELLQVKPRAFKSVKTEPEISGISPELAIPSPNELG